MITDSILISKLNQTRLDPAFYLTSSKNFKSNQFQLLKNMAKIRIGNTPKDNLKKKTVPLLTATDVNDFHINQFPKKSISQQSAEKDSTIKTKNLDILLTVKGKIANAALVTTEKGYCINQNIARLQVNNKKDAYYMLSILNSEKVKKQIKNKSVGQMNPHIRKTDLQQIKIPILTTHQKKTISQLTKKIVTSSNRIKCKTSNLLKDIETDVARKESSVHKKTFYINYSTIKKEKRLDPSYFQHSLSSMEKTISLDKIPGIKIIIGKHSNSYSQNGTPYLRAKDIPQTDTDKIVKVKSDKKLLLLHPKDIVVSRAGSPGKPFLITHKEKGFAAGDNLIVVSNFKNLISPIVLFYILQTQFVQDQIKKNTTGSKQPSIGVKKIKKIQIPVVNKDKQLHFEKRCYDLKKMTETNKKNVEKIRIYVNKAVKALENT